MLWALHALAATLPLSIAASSLIFFPLITVYLFGARWTFPRFPPQWGLVERTFLVFWGISLFSVVFGVSPEHSLRALSKDLYFLVFFLAASLTREDEQRWRLLFTFLVVSGFSGLMGCVQYAVGIEQLSSHDLNFTNVPPSLAGWPPLVLDYLSTLHGRAGGTRSHPLTYAEGLLFALAVVLAAWPVFAQRRKALAVSGLLVMGGIVLSQSRGPWLVTLVLIGLALALQGGIRRWKWLLILIPLPLIFLMASPTLRERLFSIADMKHRSNSERLRMWKAGGELWMDNFWLGVGPGNVKRAISPYQEDIDKREGPYGHLHNTFVNMAAERGLLGLGGFLALMGVLGAGCWRRLRDPALPSRALGVLGLLSLTAFLMAGLTERVYGDTEIMMTFYFVMGLCYVKTPLRP